MRYRKNHYQDDPLQEHYWPSFTDMMAMVVLVFLFIAITAFVQSIYNAYDQTQVRHELSKVTNVKKQISDIIEKKLEENVGKDQIVKGPNNTISIQGDVLFDTASTEISPKGKKILDGVANSIVDIVDQKDMSQYLYIIMVEGHTDEIPYDNWSLSANRAVAVIKYMQKANPKLAKDKYAKYLAATGYSKYKPVAEGHTTQDLQKNRRISFQIILDDEKWQNKIIDLMQDQ